MNTIHAIALAIKKLQGLAADEQNNRFYHGLGGLSMAAFAVSFGFTDKAFVRTRKSRHMALEYRGVHKALVCVDTLLCIETSTANKGAVILAVPL